VGATLALAVVNAVRPDRFGEAEAATIAAVRRRHPEPEAAALGAALRAHARAGEERRQIARLREHAAAPVTELPLFELEGPALCAALADRLAPVPHSRGGSP
jgi:hypothetical protein